MMVIASAVFAVLLWLVGSISYRHFELRNAESLAIRTGSWDYLTLLPSEIKALPWHQPPSDDAVQCHYGASNDEHPQSSTLI